MRPQTEEASNHQKLEEAWGGFSLRTFEGSMTLVGDFRLPKWQRNQYPLSQADKFVAFVTVALETHLPSVKPSALTPTAEQGGSQGPEEV